MKNLVMTAILLALIFSHSLAWSAEETKTKFGAGIILDESDNHYLDTLALVAFEFPVYNETVSVGFGYSHIQTKQERSGGLEAYARAHYAMTPSSEIFADLGVRKSVKHGFLGAGLNYQVSNSWTIEVGYRYFNEPLRLESHDRYAMYGALSYRFGRSHRNESPPSPSLPILPDIVENIRNVNTCQNQAPCTKTLQHDKQRAQDSVYIIQPGDWLLRIASEQCSTLPKILSNNPWLKTREAYVIYPGEKLIITFTSQACLEQ